MKTHIISNTDTEKIEILLPIHKMLLSQSPTSFQVDKWTLNLLLMIIKKNLKNSKKEILYSSSAPVIHNGCYFGLFAPFDIFETALNWLAAQEDLNSIKDYSLINKDIKELYELDNYKGQIETVIFTKSINNVRGYTIYIAEENIRVIFWGYESINYGEIDYDEDDFFI